MALVNRDPFARTEVHKARVYNPSVTCKWCGKVNYTPKSRRPFLFRFTIESDGGSKATVPNLFCSNDCRVFY